MSRLVTVEVGIGETVASLTLDGLPPAPSVFRTRDIIYDGALSEGFVSQWVFTFDLRANSVWAAPAY